MIKKEKTEKSDLDKNHWVIMNTKKNSIWKGPYLSYEAAKSELDYQVSKLKFGQKHNWKIEIRGWVDYSPVERDEEEVEVDDDFADFDLK